MTTWQLLAEFWTPADWLQFLPTLNLFDFSVWCIFQAKVQVMSHANMATLCLSVAVEWDWLTAEYIYKTCRSFRHHLAALCRKWQLH
jgi:hypothetical protein